MGHDSDFVVLDGIYVTLLLRRSMVTGAIREGATLVVSYEDEGKFTLEFDNEEDARVAIDSVAYGQ